MAFFCIITFGVFRRSHSCVNWFGQEQWIAIDSFEAYLAHTYTTDNSDVSNQNVDSSPQKKNR